MKFLKNRVLPFVCVFSILISLCIVPASAVTFPDAYRDTGSVDDISVEFNNSYSDAGMQVIASLLQMPDDPYEHIFWRYVNQHLDGKCGEVTVDALNDYQKLFDSFFNMPAGYTFPEQAENQLEEILNYTFCFLFFGEAGLEFEIREDPDRYIHRIYCPKLDWWVTDSAGKYPYCISSCDVSGGNQWIGEVTALDRVAAGNFKLEQSEGHLDAVLKQIQATGKAAQIRKLGSNHKCIWFNRQVLCNDIGQPIVCWYSDDKTAVNQERDPTTITTEDGDIVLGDKAELDLENMLMYLPNGSINFIDNFTYDESTKSYHIDSHDTYNFTTNNYYTWNYYINYTSITYIGQTEEYNKYYEVYYELPDGRDSADLTKEELEQLNLSIDVIPYGRSADDTSLRSLYHFDGDTRDSSYWNYCTDFTWNTGASLTYMDAGVFEGALYLDETEHDFTFTLPSMLSTHDFTVQFRYYQSATAAPVTDSYVQLGSSTVLQMSGGYFSNSAGTQLASTPVGSWNEIALIRDSGTVYTYLNGVCIGSEANTAAFDDTITFHFGDDQQTFKYFDELRVLDYALQTGGSNYECTSVPHDTNLALVLPDSALPVADEYWDWDTTIEPLAAEDLTLGYSDAIEATYGGYGVQDLKLRYSSSYTSITQSMGSVRISANSVNNININSRLQSGVQIPINSTNSYGDRGYDFTGGSSSMAHTALVGKQLTFSMMDTSNEIYSITFTVNNPNVADSVIYNTVSFDWGNLHYVQVWNSNKWTSVWIEPTIGTSLDIVYMEIVEGDTPNTGHEWVESVTILDKEDLHNPTLAVRTDLDITSYQIGGVRPSVPTKGQVWALVENERITSIQIYNGQAWEGVDGRIWTGSRWIPASSYNIVTLQDMYDIVDATPDFEYIYTESGFWTWWQKSWNAFTEKLFKVLGSGGTGSGGGCQHAYAITAETDATCTDPGERTYTCALCDNQYVESVPALGHDWIQKEETPTTYALPEGTACPDCAGLDYAAELDEDSATYSCSCNSCGTVWTVQAEVTEGETLYTCSRCGETTTGTDKENEGFFDALGNFLADGVEWVTDKLKQLVDSLDGLNKIFSDYVTTIREKAGDYPAFLSAAIAFMPEDLMAVFWFSVVAFVLLAVWKKWLR